MHWYARIAQIGEKYCYVLTCGAMYNQTMMFEWIKSHTVPCKKTGRRKCRLVDDTLKVYAKRVCWEIKVNSMCVYTILYWYELGGGKPKPIMNAHNIAVPANALLYIYIYICVCVCVCVYACINVYIYVNQQKKITRKLYKGIIYLNLNGVMRNGFVCTCVKCI